MVKPFWQSRTLWINILTGFVMFADESQLVNLVPDGWQPWVVVVLAIANVVLRMDTDKALR